MEDARRVPVRPEHAFGQERGPRAHRLCYVPSLYEIPNQKRV
jgi:hypothetical protein